MKEQKASEALKNAGSILGRLGLVVIVFFAFFSFRSNRSNDSLKNKSNVSVTQQISSLPKIKDYQHIEYVEIARDKNGLSGKDIYIDGKVIQVSSSWGNIILRVASFNNNNEIFYVTSPDNSLDFNLLVDDYVLIKGTLVGLKTYKAILGNQITIPEVLADSIELQ